MKPIITLRCCSCDSDAPGRQWYNRDTGYGLCAKCAKWIATRETPETMHRNYGEPGVHYFTEARTIKEGKPEHIAQPHPNLIKARAVIQAHTTYQLIADFEASDDAEPSQELPIIRGWLMDELEKRNKVAFDCWLESNEASPRKFFVA